MSEHETWRMRKTSDRIFGPVALSTLRAWACDGRIAPDDEVSEGDGPWRRACNVPDLGMDWLLELPGGDLFGPVPLSAFLDMLREGTIGPDLKVRRRDDTDFRRLGDVADGGLPGPQPEPEPAPAPEPPAAPVAPEPQAPPPATGHDADRPVEAAPVPVTEAVARESSLAEPVVSAPPTDIVPAESPAAAVSPSVSPPAVSVPGPAIAEEEIPIPADAGADHFSAVKDTKEEPGVEAPDAGTEPRPSSRISPPDEARMLSELQSALGVGRRFRVFDRLRPGRPS